MTANSTGHIQAQSLATHGIEVRKVDEVVITQILPSILLLGIENLSA